ncbi:MAG: hypothetical protein RIB45_05210 [Marivibrio sp.]|uniref:hypothetical protein n=1 Tax=Marivibrio sp. TaxID=2039719 RepID=UPI0032F01D24
MKKVLIGVGALIVVAAVAVFVLVSNLDSVIKEAIERVGPRVTQTDVTVDEVQLEIADGAAAIRGLHVGNPQGYQTKRAMDLGLVSVRLDTATATSDVIVIHEIVIDAPQMTYEVGDPRSNFQQIQKNVEDFIASTGAGGGDQTAADDGAGGQKQLIIENLYVRNAQVGVSAPFLQGEEVSTGIPEIHLTDIGKQDGGASPAEVAAVTLDAITERVIGAVGKLDLRGMVEDAAGQIQKGAEDAVKQGGEDAQKAIEEGVGGALKSLTGD